MWESFQRNENEEVWCMKTSQLLHSWRIGQKCGGVQEGKEGEISDECIMSEVLKTLLQAHLISKLVID